MTSLVFEHFCKEFLGHLGYRSVEVTRQAQDGGLDGSGDFRQGAITILLLDGEAIAGILIERNLGVVRQPLYLYDLDPEFFATEDA